MGLRTSTSGELIFYNDGDGQTRLFYNNDPELIDKRPRHEKFFGMTEDEIYKEYGLVFTKTNISIGNEIQYKISSDFEAELWMIKKGFIKYVRGVKVWHDEALEHGWENAWTPPEDYKKNTMNLTWEEPLGSFDNFYYYGWNSDGDALLPKPIADLKSKLLSQAKEQSFNIQSDPNPQEDFGFLTSNA